MTFLRLALLATEFFALGILKFVFDVGVSAEVVITLLCFNPYRSGELLVPIVGLTLPAHFNSLGCRDEQLSLDRFCISRTYKTIFR